MEDDRKKPHLRVLYLEDDFLDIELIREILNEAFELEFHTSESKDGLLALLAGNRDFDLILSDYRMPAFNAPEALKLTRQNFPDIPFICVSGTIGEEKAVELLKMGATDYVLKDSLARLVSSIERALKEAEKRKSLALAQEALRKQNEELYQAKVKAEESDRLKSAFLANMSHEIRTPMNGILGFTELLIAVEDPVKRDEYIGIIRESCDKLLSLINNILDLSLIEANQLIVKKEQVDLEKIFSYLFSVHNQTNGKGQTVLVKEKIPDGAEFLYSDETKITQILSNLISNAVKFTHQGSVEYGVRIEGSDLLFYVKDTGIGISPADQNLIFERFRRVEKSTRLYSGTGLGLPIAKSLVEALGGKIWVSSNLGEGATFYFTIPFDRKIS